MITNSKLRASLLMAAPLALATALLPGGALAQGCTATGTNQTCTNTGTMTGGIFDNGTLNLTNSGTITGNGRNAVEANAGMTLINRSGGIIDSSSANGIVSSPAATSFNVTNEAGALIRGNTGILSHTNGAIITNRGTITGTDGGGVELNGTGTLNNYGTISGSAVDSAVYLGANGNTINIYDGAVFNGGIDYINTTGNTTNFHTGSYILGVKRYNVASNTINLLGTGNQLITSGVVGGNGNIVVVAPQVVTTPAATTNSVTSGASTVINAVVNTPVVTPTIPALSGFSPEAPAPGIGGPGFQPASLALDPTFADRLREAFPDAALTNLNQTADLGVTRAKQGQTVDAYGNLVWVRGFGATRNLPSTSTVVGNANTSFGMLFGYDRQFEDWRIGAYAGYAYGYTRMLDSSGTLSTDYYVGGLYGRRNFGPYSVTANLAGGFMGNRSSRSINLGAEQAIGSFGGFFIAPELALSYDMALGNNWTFTPTPAWPLCRGLPAGL